MIRIPAGTAHAVTLRAGQSLRIVNVEGGQVADFAYHAAGATALFTRQAFERRFRDIHAVAQQLQGRDDHFESVGKFLLDLPLDTTFL